MIYGQIKDQVMVNVIVLENPDLVPVFTVGFEACIRIDNLPTIPSIGWTTPDLGQTWIEPVIDLTDVICDC